MHILNFDISSLNRGSTQPLVTQGDLKSLQIIVPTQSIHKTYESYRDKTWLRSKAEYKNGKREGLSFNYDGKRVLNSTCYKNDDEIIMSYCKK